MWHFVLGLESRLSVVCGVWVVHAFPVDVCHTSLTRKSGLGACGGVSVGVLECDVAFCARPGVSPAS